MRWIMLAALLFVSGCHDNAAGGSGVRRARWCRVLARGDSAP